MSQHKHSTNELETILSFSTKTYNPETCKSKHNKNLIGQKYDQIAQYLENGGFINNQLTIFHDTSHSFVKLECAKCLDGKPAIVSVGLYPGDFFSDNNENNGRCYNNQTVYEERSIFQKLVFGGSYKGSIELGDDTGIMSIALEAGVSSRAGHSYFGTFYSGVASLIPFIYSYYTQQHNDYRYTLQLESSDFITSNPFDNFSGYTKEYLNTIPHKSFNITEDGALKAIERINHLGHHCDKDYKYTALGNNCIDFVQHIYELAGLKGDHFDAMYPDSYPYSHHTPYKLGKYLYGKISDIAEYISDYF